MNEPATTRTLCRKLAALRAAVVCWLAVDGLAWLLGGLAVMVGVSLAIDRYFRMDLAQRRIMLVLMAAALVGLGWVLYRRVVRPVWVALGDRVLGLQIEHRHPELGDALVTAIELSQGIDHAPEGSSPALRSAAIDWGVRRAEGVRWFDVIDFAAMARKAAVALVFAALVVSACVVRGDVMGLWARRNLLLAETPWPQDTHLALVGVDERGHIVVPRGDDLQLRVRVDPNGRVPSVVHLDHAPRRGRRHTEPMLSVGPHEFAATFPNVLDPFAGRLRVRGGDAVTPWYDIRLVDRPAVEQLVLTVRPPAYTGRGESKRTAGLSAYGVLKGSTLRIDAQTNKPVDRARLRRGGTALAELAIDPDDPQHVYATLEPNQLDNGVFGIELIDRAGLQSRRRARFTLRVQSDQAPRVSARLEGIGDLVTPEAQIPVNLRMSDDVAIVDAALTYELSPPARTDSRAADRAADRAASGNGPAAAGRSERLSIAAVDERLPVNRIEPTDHVFDLRGRDMPTGAHLSFAIEAVDNDRVSGPKTGRSVTFAVKLVSERVLREALLRRETEQRLAFERLRDEQRQLLVETQALAADLTDTGPLSEAQRPTLGNLEKGQRLLVGRCEQVADLFRGMVQEVINNRIEPAGGTMQARLKQKIIQPIRALAAGPAAAAAGQLDAALAAGVAGPARRDRLTAA
ncbi:MAG: hypothetical protein GVY28_07835, partial [Alphaproteobacteria bacterium]|nr:hypothetical protein [Alphaproteobacteria bacterium]